MAPASTAIAQLPSPTDDERRPRGRRTPRSRRPCRPGRSRRSSSRTRPPAASMWAPPRAAVGDLEPAAAGEPVAARLDEPAGRQGGAVDGPVDRGRDRWRRTSWFSGVPVQAAAAPAPDGDGSSMARRSARPSGSRSAPRSRRGLGRLVRRDAVASGRGLAVGVGRGVGTGRGGRRTGTRSPRQQALTTSARRAARSRKDRRRSGRSRPGALDRRRVTGGG